MGYPVYIRSLEQHMRNESYLIDAAEASHPFEGAAGHATIAQVKQKIALIEGVAPEEVRLIYAGMQVENGRTLYDYNIQPDSTMHCGTLHRTQPCRSTTCTLFPFDREPPNLRPHPDPLRTLNQMCTRRAMHHCPVGTTLPTGIDPNRRPFPHTVWRLKDDFPVTASMRMRWTEAWTDLEES